mgnify:FL=1
MHLPTLKLTLIRRITELRDESLLQQVWELLMGEKAAEPAPRYDLLAEARQPVPDTISLQTLKQAQGYDSVALDRHFRELDRSIWAGEDEQELLQAI